MSSSDGDRVARERRREMNNVLVKHSRRREPKCRSLYQQALLDAHDEIDTLKARIDELVASGDQLRENILRTLREELCKELVLGAASEAII